MVDLQGFINKTKSLLTTPKEAWQQISGESSSIKDLYIKYLIAGFALQAICSFIKGSIIGRTILGTTFRTPIGSGLFFAILLTVLGLLFLYVGAWIVNWLAPKFGGNDNLEKAFSFVAHSSFPRIAVSPLVLVPFIGYIFTALVGLYSIYISFVGITPMTGVPEDKRFVFLASIIGVGIVISIIFFAICGSLFGAGMR